jgi:hypothetical protein
MNAVSFIDGKCLFARHGADGIDATAGKAICIYACVYRHHCTYSALPAYFNVSLHIVLIYDCVY